MTLARKSHDPPLTRPATAPPSLPGGSLLVSALAQFSLSADMDLPPWTVQRDIDLRNWLFGFGAGIRIESPIELREEHQQRLETALAVYQTA